MMKQILWMAMVSWIGLQSAVAQSQGIREEKQRNYTIGLHPSLFIDGGLSLEVEKRLGDTKKWLGVRLTGYSLPYEEPSPHYYWGSREWQTIQSGGEYFNRQSGVGLRLSYKQFFHKEMLYWGGGLNYSYFDITYQSEGYEPFEEDGLTFYRYRAGDTRQYFNKLNPFLSFGIQSPLRKRFFIDGFLTLGYSHSFYKSDRKAFDDTIFGFGYRGVTLGIGGRVGWSF